MPGSSRPMCMKLSSASRRKFTAPRVPTTWCTCVPAIDGPATEVPFVSTAAAQPSPKRERPTVLRAFVVLADARHEAGDRLRGDDERVLARVVAHRLRGDLEERHRARAADADDVVLVGRRIHVVVLEQAVRERRAAERVVRRGDDRADLRGIRAELVDRRDREPQQLVLGLDRAFLERRREQLRRQLEVAPRDAAAREDVSAKRSPSSPSMASISSWE